MSILGFLSLFIATSLVNFPLKPLNFNSPVIIYKKDCPYCEEVISYAKKNNIKVELYEAKNLIPLMRIFNLESVPILLDKKENKITIIKGRDEIIGWFKERYEVKEKITETYKSEKVNLPENLPKKRKKEISTPQAVNHTSNILINATNNATEESGVCTIEKPCK